MKHPNVSFPSAVYTVYFLPSYNVCHIPHTAKLHHGPSKASEATESFPLAEAFSSSSEREDKAGGAMGGG